MSRTLFWYVFRDLLRVFFVASGALAGIMSFGGLLRPITEGGLDASQAAKILGYFMPAMSTYSLPVAALFATTMVYGRLSADNEITACRAAGISYRAMWAPAAVLGLLVAMASVLLLCFIVPYFSLKVEQVIYSNLAKLVTSQIERNHRIDFMEGNSNLTIFAQDAREWPPPRDNPRLQIVQLFDPVIATYDRTANQRIPQPPEAFLMAKTAIAYFLEDPTTGEIRMQATLDDGTRVPRRFRGLEKDAVQAEVAATNFTTDPMPSPVRENTKFMDVMRLRVLLDEPEDSRRIKGLLDDFVRQDQADTYLTQVIAGLTGPQKQFQFGALNIAGPGTTSAVGQMPGGELLGGFSENYLLTPGDAAPLLKADVLVLQVPDGNGIQQPRLRQLQPGQVGLDATAKLIKVHATPDNVNRSMTIQVNLIDSAVRTGGDVVPHSDFPRQFVVPMPTDIYRLRTRTAAFYADSPKAAPDQQQRLKREMMKLYNSIVAELHARMSFSLSCVILVMVGCALGMMFKRGDFLSAFALSVIPALMCIMLIVTGQHTAESVPLELTAYTGDPLKLGLAIMWSGNVAVAVMATVLLSQLRRT
jgi:lipopolysaccharide export LptBFGC system permease protein LptF